MSRQESKNGLHLIKYANILLKGRFSALFMGTFAMVTPLALVVIIPMIFALLFQNIWLFTIGIILFSLLVGPMQLGYIKYFNDVVSGNQPKLFTVYSELKFTGHAFRGMFIALILFGMYLVGGLIWLVPAGFAVSFFSMTLFFLEKYKYPRITVAMKECAKHMPGNRLAMFAYKLIFYLVYFMLFIVGGLFLALVHVVSIDNLLIAWIVCVCAVIIFIFMYSFITLYFHASNQIFFEDVLMYRERMLENERQYKEKRAKQLEEDKVKALEEKAEIKEEKTEVKEIEKTKVKKENKGQKKTEAKPKKVKKSSTKKTEK